MQPWASEERRHLAFFGVVQDFRGGKIRRSGQRGPEAEPRWEYGAKPQKLTTCLENNALNTSSTEILDNNCGL